jgi:hypothetical protein
MTCKHDWHFTSKNVLRCLRCNVETGPSTPEQLAQDMLRDVVLMGSAWSQNGKRIDPAEVYADPAQRSEQTVSLEVAIEMVLRNGPTFETIAGLCKMAVEAERKSCARITETSPDRYHAAAAICARSNP